MKNSVAKLDHINFTVSNFSESVTWYKNIFNFDLVEEGINQIGKKWGILKSGDTMLAISECPDKTIDSSETHHQFNHFALRLQNRSEWEQKLEANNLETFYSSPVAYPHSTSWYIKDPTGYFIEVAIWKNNEVQF